MHEISIAENIVEQVCNILENKDSKVLALHLQIGALSGVVPECLEFIFPEVTKHTPLQDCQLLIKKIPLKFKCLDCGVLTIIDDILIFCENCHGTHVDILEGKEMIIEKMEVQ